MLASQTSSQLPLRQRASYKLARAGLICALILGILSGTIQIIVDFRQQKSILEDRITVLLSATKGPADLAVLTLDPVIGTQIVNGLMGYDFIIKARIEDETNEILAESISRNVRDKNLVRDFISASLIEPVSVHRIELHDPLDEKALLGLLEIQVDNITALAPFSGRSLLVFAAGLARDFILALILFAVFYWIITRPLVSLTNSVANIDPTHPAPLESMIPVDNQLGEIQLLIDKLNGSFSATSQYLAERKKIESELENHRDHLTEIVEERTRELEEAQAEMLRKQRLSNIGLITGTVAHELRNPLGTIQNSFTILQDKLSVQDKDIDLNMQRIERNIRRCNNIINELLGFTQVRELKLKSVSIDNWLENILNDYDFPGDIKLVRKLNSGTSVIIDPDRVRQAIVNLVQNACQSMDKNVGNAGSGELTIESCISEQRLEIHIKDSGHGVSKDRRTQIFEPLYSTRSFGVGLGLPLVRQIVEQHKGGVELTESTEKGSTFILWFPLAESMLSEKDAIA